MEVYFKPGDIVWVKLGKFWWPGEVADKTKVPETVVGSSKREPIAIVKFFDDENYYECVKSTEFIYHYNCERKNDFIKKGMDAFRANNPKMVSFPKDVGLAEEKTGGNPNILSDPMFTPERKRVSTDHLTPPYKKKLKSSSKKTKKKKQPVITHRRFLGFDDYESRVLIQTADDNAAPETNSESTKGFTCPKCPFNTDTLNILMMHAICHVEGLINETGPSSPRKLEKKKRKKVLSDEDYSGDEKKERVKRKYKKRASNKSSVTKNEENVTPSKSPKRTTNKEESSNHINEPKKDVCDDIIADWDDESNQDSTEETDVSLLELSNTLKSEANESSVEISSTTADISTSAESPDCSKRETPTQDTKEKDTSISCFDFDENDEDALIPNVASGRKIPRVIPIADKQKAIDLDEDSASEDEEKKRELLEESEKLAKSSSVESDDKETEELENTYKLLMDSTSKIEMPDLPNVLKSEQNFHSVETVKYPEKSNGEEMKPSEREKAKISKKSDEKSKDCVEGTPKTLESTVENKIPYEDIVHSENILSSLDDQYNEDEKSELKLLEPSSEIKCSIKKNSCGVSRTKHREKPEQEESNAKNSEQIEDILTKCKSPGTPTKLSDCKVSEEETVEEEQTQGQGREKTGIQSENNVSNCTKNDQETSSSPRQSTKNDSHKENSSRKSLKRPKNDESSEEEPTNLRRSSRRSKGDFSNVESPIIISNKKEKPKSPKRKKDSKIHHIENEEVKDDDLSLITQTDVVIDSEHLDSPIKNYQKEKGRSSKRRKSSKSHCEDDEITSTDVIVETENIESPIISDKKEKIKSLKGKKSSKSDCAIENEEIKNDDLLLQPIFTEEKVESSIITQKETRTSRRLKDSKSISTPDNEEAKSLDPSKEVITESENFESPIETYKKGKTRSSKGKKDEISNDIEIEKITSVKSPLDSTNLESEIHNVPKDNVQDSINREESPKISGIIEEKHAKTKDQTAASSQKSSNNQIDVEITPIVVESVEKNVETQTKRRSSRLSSNKKDIEFIPKALEEIDNSPKTVIKRSIGRPRKIRPTEIDKKEDSDIEKKSVEKLFDELKKASVSPKQFSVENSQTESLQTDQLSCKFRKSKHIQNKHAEEEKNQRALKNYEKDIINDDLNKIDNQSSTHTEIDVKDDNVAQNKQIENENLINSKETDDKIEEDTKNADNSESDIKSELSPRKPGRKPSRWDQKEKTPKKLGSKKKSRWDQVEVDKEKLDTPDEIAETEKTEESTQSNSVISDKQSDVEIEKNEPVVESEIGTSKSIDSVSKTEENGAPSAEKSDEMLIPQVCEEMVVETPMMDNEICLENEVEIQTIQSLPSHINEGSESEKITGSDRTTRSETSKCDIEVATKLTNPKKRFVKSFEALNKLKEDARNKEAVVESSKDEELTKSSENKDDAESDESKLKSKEVKSKEQEKLEEESKVTELNASSEFKKSPLFNLKKKILSLNSEMFDEAKNDVNTKSDKLDSDIIARVKNAPYLGGDYDYVRKTTNCSEIEKSEIIVGPKHIDSDLIVSHIHDEPHTSKQSDFLEERMKIIMSGNEQETKKDSSIESIEPETSVALLHQELSDKTNIDDSTTEIITKNFPIENEKEEPELVPIDGNLTVVSEKELSEGQIELTASAPSKKPTLLNFSMDFSDDSNDTSFEIFKKEKILNIAETLDTSKNSTETIVNEKPETEESINKDDTNSKKLQIERIIHETIEAEIMNSTIENVHEETVIDSVLGLSDIQSHEVPQPTTEQIIAQAEPIENEQKSPIVQPKKHEWKKNRKSPSNTNNEPLVFIHTAKSTAVTETCDLEDHIPSQIVCAKNALVNENVMKAALNKNEEMTTKSEPSMSKLLSRLTSDKPKDASAVKETESNTKCREVSLKSLKLDPSAAENLIKAAIKSKNTDSPPVGSSFPKTGNKAIILSEKIIRPATSFNQQTKRNFEDVEDIKPYVIAKNQKLEVRKDPVKAAVQLAKIKSSTFTKSPIGASKQFITVSNQSLVPQNPGKAKILNQTIIKPAADTVQTKATLNVEDNSDFDINSMPIVLSDELLTPESLENMPIVLGDSIQKTTGNETLRIVSSHNAKVLNKTIASQSPMQSSLSKISRLKKPVQKIIQSPATPQKIIRHTSPAVNSATKSGKYIIINENPNKTTQFVKKTIVAKRPPPSTTQSISSESSGHKIMIVTNPQGQQQRLLLTPAHQKMIGMQLPKTAKTVSKSGIVQKLQPGKIASPMTGTSKTQVIPQRIVRPPINANQTQSPQMKLAQSRKVQKVYIPNPQNKQPVQQKTILIKNQQGQTVRRIQGTDDAVLDKQVAEQIEAINKVNSLKAQQRQQDLNARTGINKPIPAIRRQFPNKKEIKQTYPAQSRSVNALSTSVSEVSKPPEQKVPPLMPIKTTPKPPETQTPVKQPEKPLDRPLNQLVIQDNMGNQTTVTEGQILALPSETVDGQPQSYMLVTLDESGNLTPLNNEALMSLDPSLVGLTGGDLTNMVLQMDTGTSKEEATPQPESTSVISSTPVNLKPQEVESPAVHREETSTKPAVEPTPSEPQVQPSSSHVQVTCNINGEPGQQIILTGDSVATQKFLDSLSEGNTDLANILANAEGSSFLIQADGQQILINTEPSDAQMYQAGAGVAEQHDQGNPMFATHPVKNQDILAAALADTDMFQQDHAANSSSKVLQSQLSPGQTLFPMNVGNVLETSLTLNSPIMTPLEVPSINSKKVLDEEADILTTHVPKNVDLPITITDPNISHTVSQQVVMAGDLQTNLELSLPISETAMSVGGAEINSPSFVYSLPNLDEHGEINAKNFSGSMPLLTEDLDEAPHSPSDKQKSMALNRIDQSKQNTRRTGMITSDGTFMEEGLCTLGGEMCSSLSEPPPDMFETNDKSNSSTIEAILTDDNSIEIPVQPQIVADLKDSSQSLDCLNTEADVKTM